MGLISRWVEAQEEGKAQGSRRRPREFFSVKQHEFTQLGQVLAGNEDTTGTFQIYMIKKTLCTKRNKLTMTEHGTKDCFWACVMIDPWLNGPITGSDK